MSGDDGSINPRHSRWRKEMNDLLGHRSDEEIEELVANLNEERNEPAEEKDSDILAREANRVRELKMKKLIEALISYELEEMGVGPKGATSAQRMQANNRIWAKMVNAEESRIAEEEAAKKAAEERQARERQEEEARRPPCHYSNNRYFRYCNKVSVAQCYGSSCKRYVCGNSGCSTRYGWRYLCNSCNDAMHGGA